MHLGTKFGLHTSTNDKVINDFWHQNEVYMHAGQKAAENSQVDSLSIEPQTFMVWWKSKK